MSTVTLVTALLRSRDAIEYHRDYFTLFRPLAESGINLVVFLSEQLVSQARSMFPDIQFEPTALEDLESYKVATLTEGARLPEQHAAKDTKNYMGIINAKTELVLRAMRLPDKPKTTHYGWIDFGISHITSTPKECLAAFKAQCQKLSSPLLAIPGIWPLGFGNLDVQVIWRFCGGLFVGDRDSVRRFCLLSQDLFARTIKETGVVSWEVNTWARLERQYGWRPDWYQSDHNKTMLQIPDAFLVK